MNPALFPIATFTELGDTIVVGRPAVVAYFYSYSGLAKKAVAILDAWLARFPANTALWYSHEETKRYLKLTSKSLAKIQADYSPKRLDKKFASYFIKSVSEHGRIDECHAYSFEMFASDSEPGYLFITFPLDHVQQQGAEAVIRWFCDWCSQFEFTHAGVGYGYEQAWFDEQSQFVGPVQLETGLRFHGVRVWDRYSARYCMRSKHTLDTAAWLTYLDSISIEDVGADAIEYIDPRVVRHYVSNGVVLQASAEPELCDTNQRGDAYALLKSVNDAIIPIRTLNWHQNGWADFDAEKENSWFSRMDK